ncbi:hypothetical protein [Bradyrhizobium sp.]|uniref:hypothetical protein n=1 Tax=Bradyrhizobium sp. TaxID=376 RepID=UPI0025C3B343|nr:hypothetical protein [Bradyrhizobium sp.]
MKTILVSATLLSVLTASASATPAAMGPDAQLDPPATGEGGNGAGSVKLASLVTSTFLFVPDSAQSLLVTVGEGGEGGRGRRFRHHRGYKFHYYKPHSYRLDRGYRPYYAPRRYKQPYYYYRY